MSAVVFRVPPATVVSGPAGMKGVERGGGTEVITGPGGGALKGMKGRGVGGTVEGPVGVRTSKSGAGEFLVLVKC